MSRPSFRNALPGNWSDEALRAPEVLLWETKLLVVVQSVTTTLPPNLQPDPARCRARPLAMNGPDAAAWFMVS